MKLSDIREERVFDVIADLIDPVSAIAQDKEITLFKKEAAPAGMDKREFAAEKLKKNAPLLLKKHKKQCMEILATIKGQTYEEYKKNLNAALLFVDLLELLNDKEFVSFFISAMQTVEVYGSALETTEAPAQ